MSHRIADRPVRFPTTASVTLFLFAVLPGGCGFGSAAIAVSAGGGSGGGATNGQSVASALVVTRTATSPCEVLFVLRDQEGDSASVELSFRRSGEAGFRPITLAPGSAPLRGIPDSSSPYRVKWDFATDFGDGGFRNDVELQLTVKDGVSPPVLANVAVGNDPPEVTRLALVPAGSSEYAGVLHLDLHIVDSAADPVDVVAEFNSDAAGGFPETSWSLARASATGIATSSAGEPVDLAWDSASDLPGFDGAVRLRLRATDSFGASSQAITESVHLDNNAPPTVVFDEAGFALGIKDRGHIPIPMRLFDVEHDRVRVLVQWRDPFGSWPALPADGADLLDLLTNAARAGERRDLQIATERPTHAGGSVGILVGQQDAEVRLPELAADANHVPMQGLAGRTLEILDAHREPTTRSWAANVLQSPVACEVIADGRRALVLDQQGGGWRLREIELTDGAVVGLLASGSGLPRAMSVDRWGGRIWVATTESVSCLDWRTGAVRGSWPQEFASGPRGIAAVGTTMAVATGDDALVRYDVATGRRVMLLRGLVEPWGIVADPQRVQGCYVAERGADRILAVDLLHLSRRRLPAKVRVVDEPSLGVVPLPSPRALALDTTGTNLLVMTQFGSRSSLRSLLLQNPLDLDRSGQADPVVTEVTDQLGDVQAGLAVGPDASVVVVLPAASGLAMGGGVSRSLQIVRGAGGAGQPVPYRVEDQVVTVDLAGSSPPAPGSRWRMRMFAQCASPQGQRNVFLWDTSMLPDLEEVQIRALAIDADAGQLMVGEQARSIRFRFDSQPAVPGGGAGLAAGDLDQDGDVDLVSASTSQAGLTILYQVQPGVYSASSIGSIGNDRSVAIADLNRDGINDIVTANGLGLSIWLQTAPGVFSALPGGPLLNSGPGATLSVAVGDLDGDGDNDLIGGLDVFLQTGPGTFTRQSAQLPAPGSYVSTTIAMADVDGDGRLDALTPGYTATSSVSVSFGTGTGAFQAGPSLPIVGGVVSSIDAADADGDGDLDLLVGAVDTSFGSSGRLQVHLQGPPGIFTAVTLGDQPYFGSNPVSARFGDIDGDGDLDVVAGVIREFATESNALRVFQRDANGNYVASEDRLPASGGTSLSGNPLTVVAEDLDGDGRLDLASAGGASIGIHLQHGGLRFAEGQHLYLGQFSEIQDAHLGDLDHDGDKDVAVWVNEPRDLIRVQSAPGLFASRSNTLSGSGRSRDVDGDGDLDLLRSPILEQVAPGTFQPHPGTPAAREAVDVDADGDMDLLAWSNGRLEIWWQEGAWTYALGGSVALGADPGTIVGVDLNADGRVDIVATTSGGTFAFIQGASGLYPESPIAWPSGVLADVDGDGLSDVLGVDGIHYQEPTRTFFVDSLGLTSPALWLAATDVDRDGLIDLVAKDALYVQRGKRLFGRVPHALDANLNVTTNFLAGDLDLDGDVDFVRLVPPGSTLGGYSRVIHYWTGR